MYAMQVRHRFAQRTAVLRTETTEPDIDCWLSSVYPTLAGYLSQVGAQIVGPPFARFCRLDDGVLRVEAGFPVDRVVPGGQGVQPSRLPSGDAVTTLHVGPQSTLKPAHQAIERWLHEHRCEAEGDLLEVYLTDSDSPSDEHNRRTEVVQVCHPS